MFKYFVFQLKKIKNFFIPSPYLKELRKFMKRREILYRTFVNEGDLCFDVGANKGDVVNPLLNIGASVVAIEPQTQCYNILKWEFGKKIVLVKKGLGEREEIKEMHISDSNTISSFSDNWINKVKEQRFKDHNWNKKEFIQMTTLDSLIKQYGTPRFIKIDVEGFELEVLKGLNNRIPFISFEYTVPEHADTAAKCIERLLEIDHFIECNYAVGDTMILKMKEWLSPKEMIDLIGTKEFKSTSMGDIYVRSVAVKQFLHNN